MPTPWIATQDGWAATLAPGIAANVQRGKKAFRWNIMLTGQCASLVEALSRVAAYEAMLTAPPPDLPHADDTR